MWLLLLGLYCGTPVSAQSAKPLTSPESSLRQHADSYFERKAYAHAAQLYSRIIASRPEDRQAIIRLADCYRMMREPQNAARWYELAFQKTIPEDPEHLFNYASALCSSGRYQQAETWYSRYLEIKPGDPRAMAALEDLNNLKLLFDSRIEIEQIPIELHGPVFSPAILDGGLVFVGEGSTGGLARAVTTWTEKPYLDLYYVPLGKNGKPGYPKYLDNNLNSLFHEGPVAFFDGGTRVILTRSASRKGQGHTRNLQLMIAERKPSGSWSTPRKLFYHRNYSIGHPAINDDGTVIYFSSTQPGGYGGSDLYRSEYKNGNWSEPVNAGAEINTSGNELFPSLGPDGTLYFASDGHGGLGGLDIFSITPETGHKPVNMAYPVNSGNDDFGLVFETDGDRGYFSSNRSGQDRIYKLEIRSQLVNAVVPVN